jgi:hypothetical protein
MNSDSMALIGAAVLGALAGGLIPGLLEWRRQKWADQEYWRRHQHDVYARLRTSSWQFHERAGEALKQLVQNWEIIARDAGPYGGIGDELYQRRDAAYAAYAAVMEACYEAEFLIPRNHIETLKELRALANETFEEIRLLDDVQYDYQRDFRDPEYLETGRQLDRAWKEFRAKHWDPYDRRWNKIEAELRDAARTDLRMLK